MKVFFSWSGERSKLFANIFADFLLHLLQGIEPWISTEIKKGARWRKELGIGLEEAEVGIICVTADNLNAEWLMFEAGALMKSNIKENLVCPILLDVSIDELNNSPLDLFQCTELRENEIKSFVHALSSEIKSINVEAKRLDTLFDKFWPEFEEKLDSLPILHAKPFDLHVIRDRRSYIPMLRVYSLVVCRFLPQITNFA